MKEIFLLNKKQQNMLTPIYTEFLEEQKNTLNTLTKQNDELLDDVLNKLENTNFFPIMFYNKNQIIGFCFVEKLNNIYKVLNLFISKNYRRKHNGKYLATKVLKQLNGKIEISENLSNSIFILFWDNVLTKFKNVQTTQNKNVKTWTFTNKVDRRSFSEKLEDTMDNIVGDTQELIYGDVYDYSNNIPAMMPDPDTEIRKINKVQTRRNLNKRIFKNKTLIKIIFSIFILGGLIALFYFVINMLLK